MTEHPMAPAKRVKPRRSIIYLVLPLAMIALAIIGFWPPYFGRLISRTPLEGAAAHPLIPVHSLLFLVWLGLIAVQAMLVRSGRVALHRRLGTWLAVFGYLAAAVGVYSGLTLSAAKVGRGEPLESAAAFVAAPLLDMAMFALFLTAALVYRRRPAVHRCMMLFTGYSFALIGVFHFVAQFPSATESIWLANFLLVVPVLMCIGWVRLAQSRIHPAWWIGLAVLVVRLALEVLATLPWWQPFGRALITPFL